MAGFDALKVFEERAAAVDPGVPVPPASTVPGREGYGWIDFEGLHNTRDLGGLPAADGKRVKRGLLLRSGSLHFGTAGDFARLLDEYDLRVVVDFRSDSELTESPDPMEELPGVRYVHATIIDGAAAGILQDERSRDEERQMLERGEVDPAAFGLILYTNLMLTPAARAGYRAFFEELLACEEGAALWHCFVGRDRCGMGSMLIETVLGVPRAEMERDFLATNVYAPAEFTAMGGARPEFFGAALRALERTYGGVQGYIEGALGISESACAELRTRYLED